jgi:hypothetical protein
MNTTSVSDSPPPQAPNSRCLAAKAKKITPEPGKINVGQDQQNSAAPKRRGQNMGTLSRPMRSQVALFN